MPQYSGNARVHGTHADWKKAKQGGLLNTKLYVLPLYSLHMNNSPSFVNGSIMYEEIWQKHISYIVTGTWPGSGHEWLETEIMARCNFHLIGP